TSNRASLPEVVGDAALLVEDPLDPEEIAERVETLLRDPALRDVLVKKGRERARMFTWERAARQVREVYDRVLGDDG
ncbi:MAG: glycosyltransferase, partial [Actinomycetota bacterium]|nr:glycosyltransferase [Actinomycetota bacterium]